MFLRATGPAALLIALGLLLLPRAWQPAVAQTVSPADVGMHAGLDVILDTYVREGLVYYRALRAERARLDRYVSNLDVPAAAFEAWSRPEQAAFWLNAYNATVLRTVINAYPIKGASAQYPSDSIQHVPGAYVAKRHRIGGRLLSLEDIEKQVLPTFDDPRMYFALGRGSLGGGRLRSEAFTAARLEQQLASVAAECVSRNECFRYDPAADRIEISPIFGWRQAEFTRAWSGDAEIFAKRSPIELAVLHMVLPHVLPTEARGLRRNTFTLAYSAYDWRLNDLTDGGPR
ncbi:DUF547 domain-containing protein [Luteitalea sp.]|uniref:DUF547 domain-containing protein n=1 Tax=Luteitalea sp. TaxID=2004800 RepID=UPI0025BC5515|nr:DUF547 domain-containing protein [Luteitalea sp.]